MKKEISLPLFFFLSFILSVTPSLAYTQFNPNPNFATTNTGYNIINSCQTTGASVCAGKPFFEWISCTVASWLAGVGGGNTKAYDILQNATGDNATGVLFFNPSPNCTWTGNTNDITLYVQPRSDSLYYNAVNVTSYSSLTNFNDTGSTFLLPRNQEGIIFLRWRTNDTTNWVYGETGLSWYDNLGGSNSTSFSGSWTNWVNTTLYVPADTLEDRRISIYATFKISQANSPVQIILDRYSFYTYDTIQPRQSYWTIESEEASTYCGDQPLSSEQFEKVNQTLKLAYMVENNTGDNNLCCVFESGNFTIGRRCTVHVATGWRNTYQARDLIWVSGLGAGSPTAYMLIKKLSTQSITYDNYYNPCIANSGSNAWYLWFNGAGSKVWNVNTTSPILCGSYAIDKTVSLVSFNISGTKFMNYNPGSTYRTDNMTFPNFQYITNAVCTCTDGVESCTEETGAIVNTNCGLYGCDPEGLQCNYPTIVNDYGYGTFCIKTINPITTNTRGWVYYNSTEVSGVPGSCAIGEYCHQYNTNSIECRKLSDNSTTQYINSTGQNDTIPVNKTTSTSLFSNPANYIAVGIGYLFGYGSDLATSQLLASIVLSMILGIGILILMSSAKVKGQILGQGFIISVLLFLILFTMIGWFPSWIMVILMVVAGLMVAKSLKVF